jgi:predicted  nucleic acid-binding Zn-ribbon protein
MACMEHECRDCGHVWFNNTAREKCPRCLGCDVANYFDEEFDHDDDYPDDGG